MVPKRKGVPIWASTAQVVAIMLIGLVAGSTFGIWRGYNPSLYSASVFVEVHQGAVRGLNLLLLAMAFGVIGCVLVLAYRIRRSPPTLFLYLLALAFIAVGGLATRLVNQPINAEIMNWTAASPPDGWESIRDTWWTWHIVRTLSSIAATINTIVAVFQDRGQNSP